MTVTVNGQPTDMASGTTVARVVADVAGHETGVAVAVNGYVLPRDTWRATELRHGDRVEIVTVVQGG